MHGNRYRVSPIPILRPQLPSAERLLRYPKSIDGSRVYTNEIRRIAEVIDSAIPRRGFV